jgi:hypothetical protein
MVAPNFRHAALRSQSRLQIPSQLRINYNNIPAAEPLDPSVISITPNPR